VTTSEETLAALLLAMRNEQWVHAIDAHITARLADHLASPPPAGREGTKETVYGHADCADDVATHSEAVAAAQVRPMPSGGEMDAPGGGPAVRRVSAAEEVAPSADSAAPRVAEPSVTAVTTYDNVHYVPASRLAKLRAELAAATSRISTLESDVVGQLRVQEESNAGHGRAQEKLRAELRDEQLQVKAEIAARLRVEARADKAERERDEARDRDARHETQAAQNFKTALEYRAERDSARQETAEVQARLSARVVEEHKLGEVARRERDAMREALTKLAEHMRDARRPDWFRNVHDVAEWARAREASAREALAPSPAAPETTPTRPPDEPCKCGKRMLQPWWYAVTDAGNEGTDYVKHTRESCLTATERRAAKTAAPETTAAKCAVGTVGCSVDHAASPLVDSCALQRAARPAPQPAAPTRAYKEARAWLRAETPYCERDDLASLTALLTRGASQRAAEAVGDALAALTTAEGAIHVLLDSPHLMVNGEARSRLAWLRGQIRDAIERGEHVGRK
jgi:hypothetical protein